MNPIITTSIKSKIMYVARLIIIIYFIFLALHLTNCVISTNPGATLIGNVIRQISLTPIYVGVTIYEVIYRSVKFVYINLPKLLTHIWENIVYPCLRHLNNSINWINTNLKAILIPIWQNIIYPCLCRINDLISWIWFKFNDLCTWITVNLKSILTTIWRNIIYPCLMHLYNVIEYIVINFKILLVNIWKNIIYPRLLQLHNAIEFLGIKIWQNIIHPILDNIYNYSKWIINGIIDMITKPLRFLWDLMKSLYNIIVPILDNIFQIVRRTLNIVYKVIVMMLDNLYIYIIEPALAMVINVICEVKTIVVNYLIYPIYQLLLRIWYYIWEMIISIRTIVNGWCNYLFYLIVYPCYMNMKSITYYCYNGVINTVYQVYDNILAVVNYFTAQH